LLIAVVAAIAREETATRLEARSIT